MDSENNVGRIYKIYKAMVIDDNEEKLGPNQTGEICILSDIPFIGYYADPDKTNEAKIQDQYFRTGDLGYFDDDCFLYIVGRKKEMLKYNNFQVQPAELEEIIESIEGVETSCVVGVLNEKTGNDIIFAFVKKIVSQNYGDVSEQKILEFVNSKVIDAKKLRGGVHFVDSFPQTPSGKIIKNDVKKIAESKIMVA